MERVTPSLERSKNCLIRTVAKFFSNASIPLMRLIFAFAAVLTSLAAQDTRLVRDSEAQTPADERSALQVPVGFKMQLFASEPQINKPINMAFDQKGRLWVSSTVEYPYAAAKDRWADPLGTRVTGSRDAIKILEDTDGDGQADKVTDFADGLNIPTGVLPWHRPEHRAGCIAFSIPNIWYFADTDGDDKADVREVLFGPLGYEKDTHGMCSSFRLGSDGWVYATHGFNNTSHFSAIDSSALDLHSGNTFRFRPDGSRVELYTSGQVNPYGLCWDQHGNLYSADCHSNPITQLIRGAHYPSFGKPHDGLGFAPNICEHSHGSTGLCGIVYIDGGIWGPEWENHLLVGNCVTSKVNHDHLSFSGSTPKANEQPDFLTSSDPWFRPVDLQLGPDHALYVADFYNRIIGHYEVPLDHPGRDRERGRIWRIVKDKTFPRKPTAPSPAQAQRNALAQLQPALQHLPDLLSQLKRCPAEDLSLRHHLRLVLRDHLTLPGAITALSEAERLAVMDILRAVPTAEAAAVLMKHLPDEFGLIARSADATTLEQVITRGQLSPRPLEALEAVHDALLERGLPPPASMLAWATGMAEAQLSASTVSTWTSAAEESPWCIEDRKTKDGSAIRVLSSLNKALKSPESRTDTLRSRAFPAPATLSFQICGHRGFPNTAAHDKNLVRLMDAAGKVLHQAFPPRHDATVAVTWDLSEVNGQTVHLEIVDGDSGKAYAWMAIGGIEPAVIAIDGFDAEAARLGHLRLLATILRSTAPVALRDRLAAFLPPSPRLDAAPASPELQATLAQRQKAFALSRPDLTKGEALFTANCTTCHALGGKGGLIGPQLDGIGQRGPDRLMEDILDPNRNVDAHFQLHQITLKDGSSAAGFLRGEVGQSLILVNAAGQEQRLAKASVQEDRGIPMSLMPPTFSQTLPEPDFYALVAWLLKH